MTGNKRKDVPEMEVDSRLLMLQASLDLIDQGFTLFDKNLKLVAANRAFATLLDFPDRLMKVGTPFEAFMRYNAERGEYGPGDVEQLVAERVNAARLFKPHHAERVRPGGQIIAIRGEPLPHRGFITLYTDITAQREAEHVIRERNIDLERHVQERTTELETAYQRLRAINQVNQQIAEELRRSEARLRLITDAIPARIAYIDKDSRFRFANLGYVQWFDSTKEALIGHKVSDVLGPSLYEEVGPHIERALEGETVGYEYAMTVRTAQGGNEMRYARSELVPEIVQGEVLGVFVLATDITEQKRTQTALMHAQKMEAVGQLAGGIAHDLNNMLTVVLGNLSGLEERTRGNREINELVDPALLATRRGAALIKRLLTFSRQQPLEPRPVDLPRLVQGLQNLLRRTLPENISLSLEFGGALPRAMTDPHQLESALLNLCLNARDAMPSGGALTLRVDFCEFDADSATAHGLQPGRHIRIAVTDTGCGMDEETLMRACEPFFTTKGFGSGSGLGLSMAYGFAQQSSGSLRICSTPGHGSKVFLFLPSTDMAAETEEETPGSGQRQEGQPLVLLVEDDPEVRKVIRRQLLELGNPVLEAAHGREALDMLDQIEEIGIVITDVVMPGGMDGMALARHVRATRPQIGILLVSGYERGSAEEFKLLNKPFTKSELADSLAGLFS